MICFFKAQINQNRNLKTTKRRLIMRHLANLGVDQLLNLLFGWHQEIRGFDFLICTESPDHEKEILEHIQIPLDYIQQERALSYLTECLYKKYFWFDKQHIIRFTIYLSTALYMWDGSVRYLPFVGFEQDCSEEERDKVIKSWHGRYVLKPQGFFVSMHKFNGLAGVYYLPIGLLNQEPKNYFYPQGLTTLNGIGPVYIKGTKLDNLITLAVLDRQSLTELLVIGDVGEALPSYLLEEDESNQNQLNLFV